MSRGRTLALPISEPRTGEPAVESVDDSETRDSLLVPSSEADLVVV
jgi:hypothetical protein